MSTPTLPQHPTVLVFDDEDDLREVMCRMLERRGFTALGAGDVADAIAVCKEHRGDIHVLLADLGMPDAIGLGVAREAQAVRPELRVLYVSGLPKDSAIAQGLLGVEDTVVQKPFTTDSLVSAVKNAIGDEDDLGAP